MHSIKSRCLGRAPLSIGARRGRASGIEFQPLMPRGRALDIAGAKAATVLRSHAAAFTLSRWTGGRRPP